MISLFGALGKAPPHWTNMKELNFAKNSSYYSVFSFFAQKMKQPKRMKGSRL